MITLLNEIELAQANLLPKLIGDYLNQSNGNRQLYKYPFSLAGFEQAIQDKAAEKTDRPLLVDVLTEQYGNIPTSETVRNNIARLADARTFTVTASHQPCLLLGPLYNIYKIAGAINLAKKLAAEFTGYRFVPVFWLGSEDHDIAELNHTYVNGKRIEWTNPGTGAMGRLKTNSLQDLIPEMKALGIGEEVLNKLQSGIAQYATFGRLTQYLVDDVFKEHGLVVIDQDNARLKQRFVPVITDEIFNQKAQGILKTNIDFLEANYKAQARPREINFFYLGDGYRERIVHNAQSGKYEVNNTSIAFTPDEMATEIKANPARFSPNVIFRPLYQETILPNLAFIGGAGELSYWLELKPLFEYYHINYPVQVLRPMAGIVSNGLTRKLEKLNLKIEDFFGDIEQLINRYVQANLSTDGALDMEKEKVSAIFDAIADKAAQQDPTLKQNVAAEKQKALSTIDNIASKIFKAEKRKQETAINQIRAIHVELFPDGVLQERHENYLPFNDAQFISQVVEYSDAFRQVFRVFLNG
jgi:bacillithiol synthase